MRRWSLLLIILVFVTVAGCGSGGSSSEEAAGPQLRPVLAEFLAAIQAAEDTYDLEDLMDDFRDVSRAEFRGLMDEEGWQDHLDRCATLPDELVTVADSLIARWHQVGVVHDGINHRDDIDDFVERRNELKLEVLDLYGDIIKEELRTEDPDLESLVKVAEMCEPLYAELTTKQQRDGWLDEFGKTPTELKALLDDPQALAEAIRNR